MKVFKFYSEENYYGVSGKTQEEAEECLFENVGEMPINKVEEIIELRWDEPFIEIHEDNDTSKPSFKISIREALEKTPTVLFSNDRALID